MMLMKAEARASRMSMDGKQELWLNSSCMLYTIILFQPALLVDIGLNSKVCADDFVVF